MAPPLRASIAVPATADLPGLVTAAGGVPANARYEDGVLSVLGVSQAALEAAFGLGVDAAFASRQALLTALDARLAAKTAEGMPWRGKVLQINQESLNDLTSSALAASIGVLPSPFAWRMKDNTFLPVDPPAMTAMAAAAMTYVYGLYGVYWTHKARIVAAPDADALAAIDLSAGWDVPVPA